mgnify:CR=1 FL=1
MKKHLWSVAIGALLLMEPVQAAEKIPNIQLPVSLVRLIQLSRLLRLEETRYEGDIWYFPVLKSYPATSPKGMRVFWWARVNGFVRSDDAYYFPNLWTNNTDIAALMADIGVPTTRTYSNSNIWSRMTKIWGWMSFNTAGDGDVYSTGPGFPSIADMAWAYQQYGVIQHGPCTSTAQLMATLMARAGIPVNRIALGHAYWGDGPQHVFVLLLMEEGWYYLDPTDCHAHSQLPVYADRASFGNNQSCDYTHPFEVNILPRSNLLTVPLCLAE